MTALELAAALLVADSDLLPEPPAACQWHAPCLRTAADDWHCLCEQHRDELLGVSRA